MVPNNKDNSDESACLGDCKRLDFIVNFTDIGWEKWILYPKSFNAYYCNGKCDAPLAVNINEADNNVLLETSTTAISEAQVTNHAQIMSIIEYNSQNNKKLTNCVPTKLNPLKIVYVNEDGEIEIKEYENMIVMQCGCR